MSATELVQSTFSLPGGKGKYLDTLVEFLTWLQPREKTTREDAIAWFDERFSAAKSAQYYLPVIRDLGAIELERGRGGAIHLTELGRMVLGADRDEQVRSIADRFLAGFVANREILALYATSDHPLGQKEVRARLAALFPSWTTAAQFEFRLSWMDSLGLLKAVSGRTFEITEIGREFAAKYPAELPPSANHRLLEGNAVKIAEPPVPLTQRPLEDLIAELRAASTDSSKPVRFEAALARAFEALGFSVKQVGDSGDTDVLVEAPVGESSYLVVVDAKARGSGKVDQLEVLSLKDHQALNEAEYAVVVAGSFAGGKVPAHALDQGVTLVPLPVLEDWLRLHDAWPQDLLTYRAILASKGLIEKLPVEVVRVANDRKRWGKLLADVVDLLGETYGHGLTEPLTARDVYKMLVIRKQGVHYPEKDVAGIMELLSHPVVGALAVKDGGYSLVMSRETLGLRLRRLAEEIESLDVEESA
jgi:hypothetical protein